MMMKKTFKTAVEGAKLVLIFALFCSLLSFSAMAQEKPMEAAAQAVLIKDLQSIVKGSEPDRKLSALVIQKWNARQDLAGKTKTQIINLLFEDVKSVIKDPGMQYQISSMFASYKIIPDENFSDTANANKQKTSKEDLVIKLVDLVASSHPYAFIEQELAKFSDTKETQAAKDEDRKIRVEGFESALKTNKQLNADQKKFVRAHYDELIKMTDKITEDAMDENFPPMRWILGGLEKFFNGRFTIEEIKTLNAFFEADKGESTLNYVRQTEMAQLIIGNGGKPDFTAADKAEYDKFIATPLGKKFINVYLKETKEYVALKEGEVRRNVPNADGFAIYEPANLNKLFNKFVAENYKK